MTKVPMRRVSDSVNTLLSGVQNLINSHDINDEKGHGNLQAHAHLVSVHAKGYFWAGRSYVLDLKNNKADIGKVLTLSSICVEPQYQRQGFFLRLLKGLEVMADENNRVLRLECVLHEGLDGFLVQRVGYFRSPIDAQTFLRSKPE